MENIPLLDPLNKPFPTQNVVCVEFFFSRGLISHVLGKRSFKYRPFHKWSVPEGLLFRAWPLCTSRGDLLHPSLARQSKETVQLSVVTKTWAPEADPESNPRSAPHRLYDLEQDIYLLWAPVSICKIEIIFTPGFVAKIKWTKIYKCLALYLVLNSCTVNTNWVNTFFNGFPHVQESMLTIIMLICISTT